MPAESESRLAIIYTANPVIADDDLVQLDDPEGLFLPSHLVPVASDDMDPETRDIINRVSAKLGADELVELNALSIEKQAWAAKIARDWLATT